MASLLFNGPPKDEHGKPKKIPKVAVYVVGAAFAMTVGLTALIVPYARQALKAATPTVQFMSHRNALKQLEPLVKPAPAAQPNGSRLVVPEPPSELEKARIFNAREERHLYGASMAEEQAGGESTPVGGLLGLQAFAIATGLVFGTAGLGAWGVAKALGVKDMEEFTIRMRDELQLRMPVLSQRVKPPGVSQATPLDQWLHDIDKEVEMDQSAARLV